ncbi:TKL protein kinase [Saprolegnia diclina VS20]|uniref:TKL protein kinase n=1 Tax=Saprolegnia diclina (strain VS20) TaxID=1156394 RepID=T0Q648_SAPDV|nr:TKL protein kinase [Saprolegnia diclina VS20]EQC30076.1 TKL protein kinase [Saprolegnia diclina VS20]|eukprot:XP_008616419.1 TKL protein kinase [Saprolegnia diclina VS20]
MDLFEAVARGDTRTVAELLHDGADPNSRDHLGDPALYVAARGGHLDTVEVLLNAGAIVDSQRPSGDTSLMIAASSGPVELVHVLLANGANVNHNSGCSTALGCAVYGGNDDIVELLLAVGANVHVHDDSRKASPIMSAACLGLVAIATQLLAAGARVSDLSKDGVGPLFCAALEGHADMIRLLAARGADLDATSPHHVSPMHAASGRGHLDAVITLLQAGAKLDNPNSFPCLNAAATCGRTEIVALLLREGADVNANNPRWGAAALYVAAATGHADVVRQLVHARAKLDERAVTGKTAMMIAQAKKHAHVVEVLQDARMKKAKLLHATRHGDVLGVRALLADGLSVNETDEHGNTLVHLALLGGHAELLAELLKDPSVELGHINEFGESPIAIATKKSTPLLVQHLHKAQSTVTAQVATRPTLHLQELGRGSYGIVFKDTLFGQDVAVKSVLNKTFGAANLRDEIRVLNANPSPYIVRLLATADAASNAPQLIFEYMDGGSVTRYLEKVASDKPVSVTYAPIEIAWVVANALKDLHANNIVHRDIKTDNILLSSTQYIKVGDVGIAKEETTTMTTGAGTSKWRAPEVLTSGSRYGTPADVYSFGILLETLFPEGARASSDNALWYKTLAMQCTVENPALRPTAADIVESMRPKVQSYPHLVVSMAAFESDCARGPPLIASVAMPAPMTPAPTSAHQPIRIPTRSARSTAPLSHEEAFLAAVAAGNVDAVDSFLRSGVHPDSTDTTQETALIRAVFFGHSDVVDLLLAFRADVNSVSAVGLTALHEAARQPSGVMLRKLLCATGIDANPRNFNLETPLHVAIGFGLDANVVALVNAGADVEAADEKMHRPLYYAATRDLKAITMYLVQHGARTWERDQDNETVLHAVLSRRLGHMATILVDTGGIANLHSNGQSPLHRACECGVSEVIPVLLAHGADVNAAFRNASPLAMSIYAGHADVVAALVASPKIDFNERLEHDYTLLHLATSMGNLAIARVMLQAGIDYDRREAKMGLRAIEMAERLHNHAMVDVLQPAYTHRLALLQAMRDQDVSRFQRLLLKPYSCNIVDEVGCSLVHLAVVAKNETMLDQLLAMPRVLVNTSNTENKTPLAIAIQRGYASMAEKLFDRVHRAAVDISSTEYEVTTTELGRGGYGVVLLGSYQGQKVAVKKLRNANQRKSFNAEVDALVAVPSPYLVQLVAIADVDTEMPALLLEYMDGGSLRTYLDQKRFQLPYTVHVTNLQVAWAVANALKDLHAKNIAHRDIKSENVLLSSTHFVKLGDLGLARREATEMTEAPGTRYWMAPEVLRANGTAYGLSADMYAFGVLLTEVDTLQLPYYELVNPNPVAIVRGVIDGTLRPTLTAKCEPWLRDLVELCLCGDPTARPTAAQVVDVLRGEMAMTAAKAIDAETYLRAVATDNSAAVTELLDQGVAVNGTLPGGESLLLAATTAGASETVTLLLQRGANVSDMSGGRTPLHEAATLGHAFVQRRLLDAGADVDARDHEGKTPLMCAFHTGNALCVSQLVATGADVVLAATDGTTALDKAREFDGLKRFVPMLEVAASRQENATQPEIFCIHCTHWHAVQDTTEAMCTTCGKPVSRVHRMLAIVWRLIRLQHRGYPVDWSRTCHACHSKAMTVFDALCPECAHSQRDVDNLKVLHVRFKKALKPTAARLAPLAIPRGVLQWLAKIAPPRLLSRDPELVFAPTRPVHEKTPSDDMVLDDARSTQRALVCGLGTRRSNRRLFESGLSTHAIAGQMGQASLARTLYAATVAPVVEMALSDAPEPGVPFELQDHVVVHAFVRDTTVLDAIARCASPFILPVVGFSRPDCVYVKVSAAKTLRGMLQTEKVRDGLRAECPMKLQCLYVVANALQDLHANGIVHGHISSHSILVSMTEFMQVDAPSTDDLCLQWTAPEVLAGDSPPSLASDIYAFGILMTELDTFQLPFDDYDLDDAIALVTAVVDGGLRPAMRDDCETWYCNLAGLCMSADPLSRPTASDLVELFQVLLDDALDAEASKASTEH